MKSNKEKKTKHIKGAYKSVNVDLNDIELFKLCFNVDDDGFRQFTGEKGEIVILERYVSDIDDHREFNPAIIEEIDEYGHPWVRKSWPNNEEGKCHSHSIALESIEMELLDSDAAQQGND